MRKGRDGKWNGKNVDEFTEKAKKQYHELGVKERKKEWYDENVDEITEKAKKQYHELGRERKEKRMVYPK